MIKNLTTLALSFGLLLFAADVRADTVLTTNNPVLLQQALNAGGRVTFSNFSGTLTLTNALVVTNQVLLDGGTNGRITLSGGGTLSGTNGTPTTNGVRVFLVNSNAQFTLLNLTLANGRGTNGGAILNRGTLTVSNCSFFGNAAVGADGANGANGANSSGAGGNGQAGAPGGSVWGGALFNLGTAAVFRCEFLTNMTLAGYGGNGGNGGSGDFGGGDGGSGGSGGSALGGAVYNASRITLRDCVVNANLAYGGDGGIGGNNGAGPGLNAVGKGGAGGQGNGAGFYNAGVASLAACAFFENIAGGGNSQKAGTPFDVAQGRGFPGGDSYGGGVCNTGTNTMVNCTVDNNQANGGNGGNGGDSDFAAGDGGNGGSGWGGSVFNSRSIAATNCTFAESSAFGGFFGVGGTGPFPGSNGSLGAANGGNLANNNGTFVLHNCILAHPTGGTNATTVTNVVTTPRITCLTNIITITNEFGQIVQSNAVTCLTNIITTTNILNITNVAIGINAYGSFSNAGFNLSSDATPLLSGTSLTNTEPRLGPLQNNGGFTPTMALLQDSPAINRAATNFWLATDQRGVLRPQGGRGDIGAFEAEAANLSGAVTIGSNGLAGVSVTVGTNAAVTDVSGHYAFTNLPAGTYSVRPSLSGYDFSPPSNSVVVGLSAVTTDFTAVPIYRLLTGRVTEGTNGLPGVVISLLGATNVATTDTAGRYSFTNLPPGTYTVLPARAGYEFTPPISLATVGPAIATNDFEAVGIYSIAGRVFGGSEQAGLLGAVVSSGLQRTVVTDPDGYYLLTGLGPGSRIVTVTLGGFAFVPASQEVDLDQAIVSEVDFEGFAAFAFSGRIFDGADLTTETGLSNVVVTLTNILYMADDSFFTTNLTTLSDVNGNYAFTNVPSGSVTVIPALSGFLFDPTDYQVTLNEDLVAQDFVGNRVSTISGRVTLGGVGLGNVTVTVFEVTNAATTDATGHYTISNLFEGSYEVSAQLAGFTFAPVATDVSVGPDNASNVDFTAAGALAISGSITWKGVGVTNVTLAISNQILNLGTNSFYSVSNLPPGVYSVTPFLSRYVFDPGTASVTLTNNSVTNDFRAIPLLNISGRVTNGVAGGGLGDATVTAGAASALTDASGFYALGNVPATNRVVPAKSGFWFSPSFRELELESNFNTINFTASTAFTISGRVTEGTNAFAGVTVSAGGRTATTDTNGNYVLSGFAPGSNTVTATRAGYQFTPATVTVVVGPNATNVDFSASGSLFIGGRITEASNGLSGVTVAAGGRTAVTDTNGNYLLSGFTPSTNTVAAMQPGYVFTPASTNVDLRSGVSATNVNFTARGTLSIRGRLTEGDSGLSNLTVTANGVSSATDTNGNYVLTNLSPRIYMVAPPQAGIGFLPASTNADLSAAVSATNVNFTARPPHISIAGSNAVFRLTVLGLPARPYLIQTASNLSPAEVWQNLLTNIANSTGVLELVVTNSADSGNRFFRPTRP